MKVLIIEDDPEIIQVVSLVLELRWPEANLVSTFYGEKGVELAEKELPDVIILDLGLPDTDGFEVLRQIRGWSDVPLVILTVRGDEVNKIKGLELGADDYIVKPFSPGEFLARVKAVLRRREVPETTTEVAEKLFLRGKLRIDFASREVSVGDKLLKLGPSEFDVLYQLVSNEGMVLSDQVLMEKAFGPGQTSTIEYLRVLIQRLKEKLEQEPGNPTMILYEEGKGYKFVSR